MSTRAEATLVCSAPVAVCFDTIADFAAYPEWQRATKEAHVRARDGAGSVTVAFRVDAKLREVAYVLRYHLERPHRIWWDYVEGDARDVDGEWVFEPADDGHTRCTYRLAVDVGGFVPGAVKRALAEQAVRSTLHALERRVSSAP